MTFHLLYMLKDKAIMKKLLLLLTVTLTLTMAHGQANVYHPFPDSNAIWRGSYDFTGCTPFYHESYSYVINGDTIIGSHTYHKLYIPFVQKTGDTIHCSSMHTSGYQGCIRQDIPNKKVYYILPNDTIIRLLYDFSLQIGNSVINYVRYGGACCGIKVANIDSILVGSTYRKRWLCADTNFYFSYSFIEGVGNKEGPLESECESGILCLDPISFLSLVCFNQNGITLYPDATANCDLVLSINSNDPNSNQIRIFPNPFRTETTLQTDKNFKNATLTVYNLYGQEVKQIKNISGQTVTLTRDNLPSGLYFIRLTQDNKILATDKLVITD